MHIGPVCLAVAVVFAGWGVAWQAGRAASFSASSPDSGVPRSGPTDASWPAVRDDLAQRLGRLQAQAFALESAQARLIRAAGIVYTAPELVARPAQPPARAPAESVDSGRVIGAGGLPEDHARPPGMRDLGNALERLEDQFGRLDDHAHLLAQALARQSGLQAALPTHAPVAGPRPGSSFGWRRDPLGSRHRMHDGLDFPVPHGTLVRAASGGLVTHAATTPGYGKMVELYHGKGLTTRYAHASRLLVRRGDFVVPGQGLARAGSTGHSTGPHVHFEVRVAGHALDPGPFLRRGPSGRLAQPTTGMDPWTGQGAQADDASLR